MTTKTINVKYLARVEGEGGLNIRIKDDAVSRVELRIFEPPRFFEAFLRGRNFTEAPDITSRICGICPVAYQMSAVHAMEGALGVTVTGPLCGGCSIAASGSNPTPCTSSCFTLRIF
jgi:sulfhydrogenase subunit alpha